MLQAPFAVELGVLVVAWLAGWGVAFWLVKRGINYLDNTVLTSTVFLGFAALLVALFRRRIEPLTGNPTALPFIVLFLAAATAIGLYAVCPRYFRRPDGLIARHPEEFYLQLDPRYLVTKSFEVLFQQLVIVVLTLLLASTGLSLMSIVLAFLLLFGALHLPMLRLIGSGPGLYYALAAATGGGVFPLLILGVHYGFVYSYGVHWFSYAVAGVFAWWRAAGGGRGGGGAADGVASALRFRAPHLTREGSRWATHVLGRP